MKTDRLKTTYNNVRLIFTGFVNGQLFLAMSFEDGSKVSYTGTWGCLHVPLTFYEYERGMRFQGMARQWFDEHSDNPMRAALEVWRAFPANCSPEASAMVEAAMIEASREVISA